ncbi:hypothetical protein LENED_011567 [Lentinula edodes]|uniref:Uncharacterized protein n=1 Tax=Lentinula edodes TaxID=5353 RepID=A0A1Q3EQF3_LENED|nr:hypothetical protein LENED_011567 [Lentinula edodes]
MEKWRSRNNGTLSNFHVVYATSQPQTPLSICLRPFNYTNNQSGLFMGWGDQKGVSHEFRYSRHHNLQKRCRILAFKEAEKGWLSFWDEF